MTDEPRKPNNSELLLHIVRDIAEIKATLKQVSEFNQDHETRIRDLEKARWSSAWITGILSSVLTSAIVAVVIRMVA